MMKTVPAKTIVLASRSGWMALVALVLTVHLARGANGLPETKRTGFYHSVKVSRNQNSKVHRIRLYPDGDRQAIFFSVNGIIGKHYQLFLFDMDSKMVSQIQVGNRETSVLHNLSRGTYLFEVFLNDEQVESGQLTLK